VEKSHSVGQHPTGIPQFCNRGRDDKALGSWVQPSRDIFSAPGGTGEVSFIYSRCELRDRAYGCQHRNVVCLAQYKQCNDDQLHANQRDDGLRRVWQSHRGQVAVGGKPRQSDRGAYHAPDSFGRIDSSASKTGTTRFRIIRQSPPLTKYRRTLIWAGWEPCLWKLLRCLDSHEAGRCSELARIPTRVSSIGGLLLFFGAFRCLPVLQVTGQIEEIVPSG
jgi:hypothetical protein